MSNPLDPRESDSEGRDIASDANEIAEYDVPTEFDAVREFDGATEVDTPGDIDTDGSPSLADVDADPELRVLFWKLVLLHKVAILGTTLGVLLVVFDQGPAVGPELLAGSLVLLGYALYVTKRGKDRIDAGEFHDEDAADGVDSGAHESAETGSSGDPPEAEQ